MAKTKKKGFAETVDTATDKIDEAAVKVESFFSKIGNFFKNNWKWLIATVSTFVVGFILGAIIF